MRPLRVLSDSLGRRIEYLRISLTERCDLRCVYCRPREGGEAAADVLAAQEVVHIAEAATRLGVRRVRLTGGEPLLREDLEEICARLAGLEGLKDLSLTTNGQRLAGRAEGLAKAGLRRVNVSLDSLEPRRYAQVTGGGDLGETLQGLEAALEVGLEPVKVNVVLTSAAGAAEAELERFAELVARRPVHVRFIEGMPTCVHTGYVPAAAVLEALGRRWELRPVPGPPGGGPARYWRLGDSLGTVGVIAAISEPFCGRCNRLRVTAGGELRPCLFSARGMELLPALRGPRPVASVAALLWRAAAAKPARYAEVAGPAGIGAMHAVGG